MRHLLHFIFFSIISIPVKAHSSTIIVPPASNNQLLPEERMVASLLRLKPQDITRLAGKKISLKEKIVLGLLRHKFKKQLQYHGKKEIKNNGKTAFILGLTGLIGLIIPGVNLASIPLAILSIVIGAKARKEDPHNKKAITGIILGIVTLTLLLIIGVIVAIVLTVGPW